MTTGEVLKLAAQVVGIQACQSGRLQGRVALGLGAVTARAGGIQGAAINGIGKDGGRMGEADQ